MVRRALFVCEIYLSLVCWCYNVVNLNQQKNLYKILHTH